MSVEVRLTAVLQRVVGAKAVQMEGETVGEVLGNVNAQYPGFREQITMEDAFGASSDHDELKTMILSAGGSIGNMAAPANARR